MKTTAKSNFVFGYVSKLFVEKELKSLKRHKSTGIDNFQIFLKIQHRLLLNPICRGGSRIFYMSVKTLRHETGGLGGVVSPPPPPHQGVRGEALEIF